MNVEKGRGFVVVDASDSRTTYVISVDGDDQEVMGVVHPRPARPVWKLLHDGGWWPPAVLQGDDFHAALVRPLFEFKGALSVREGSAQPVPEHRKVDEGEHACCQPIYAGGLTSQSST